MAQRSSYSSAGIRQIHRELDRRRKLAAVAKGGFARKSSAPPPPPPPRRSAPIPSASAGAAVKKPSAPLPAPRSATISRSPRRERVLAPLTPPPRLPCPAAADTVKKGTTVLVRTRVGRLPTGQCLVIWLSAVVISAAEDGYLRVVYNNGKLPLDEHYGIMHVARDQVKDMPSAVIAPAPAAAAPPRPLCATTAPRPTVAGNSLPVLKKLEKEMWSTDTGN